MWSPNVRRVSAPPRDTVPVSPSFPSVRTETRVLTTPLGRRLAVRITHPSWWSHHQQSARRVARAVGIRAVALVVAAWLAPRAPLALAIGLALAVLAVRSAYRELLIRRCLVDIEKAGPRTARVTRRLCAELGIPVPRLLASREIGGFAAGAGEYVGGTFLAVSGQLEKTLTEPELRAVVAHELAHVRHHDSRTKRGIDWVVNAATATLLGVTLYV